MATKTVTASNRSRLKELYLTAYSPELKTELKLANVHEVPRLEKIVVNIGLGRGKDDKKLHEVASNTLRKITGQQPIDTFAKKSIASFKLREGSKIGLKVTLRDERMYEFADRLINLVLPRVRDFHGVKDGAFDRQGNYSIGFTDQSVFPELSFEETTTSHGLSVVFVVRSRDRVQAQALLTKLGVPFEKKEAK